MVTVVRQTDEAFDRTRDRFVLDDTEYRYFKSSRDLEDFMVIVFPNGHTERIRKNPSPLRPDFLELERYDAIGDFRIANNPIMGNARLRDWDNSIFWAQFLVPEIQNTIDTFKLQSPVPSDTEIDRHLEFMFLSLGYNAASAAQLSSGFTAAYTAALDRTRDNPTGSATFDPGTYIDRSQVLLTDRVIDRMQFRTDTAVTGATLMIVHKNRNSPRRYDVIRTVANVSHSGDNTWDNHRVQMLYVPPSSPVTEYFMAVHLPSTVTMNRNVSDRATLIGSPGLLQGEGNDLTEDSGAVPGLGVRYAREIPKYTGVSPEVTLPNRWKKLFQAIS